MQSADSPLRHGRLDRQTAKDDWSLKIFLRKKEDIFYAVEIVDHKFEKNLWNEKSI